MIRLFRTELQLRHRCVKTLLLERSSYYMFDFPERILLDKVSKVDSGILIGNPQGRIYKYFKNRLGPCQGLF